MYTMANRELKGTSIHTVYVCDNNFEEVKITVTGTPNVGYLKQIASFSARMDVGVTDYELKLSVIQLWNDIVKTLMKKARSNANTYWSKVLNGTATDTEKELFDMYDWLDCGTYETIRINTNPFGSYPETKTASVDYVAKICYYTTLKALTNVRKEFAEKLRVCEDRIMARAYTKVLADLKHTVDTLDKTAYNDYAKLDALTEMSRGITNKAPTYMKANGALHIA